MSDVPLLGQTPSPPGTPAQAEEFLQNESEKPQVRILVCFECKTQEQIPDYKGPPQNDVVLHYVDEKHGGGTEQPHYRSLMRVSEADWKDNNKRRQIVDRIWDGKTGFTPSYYDVKDTMQDDAVKCFSDHHRAVPCIDWHDSTKLIRPPTMQARRELSKEFKQAKAPVDHDRLVGDVPTLYLCDFCPVKASVDEAKRRARGL